MKIRKGFVSNSSSSSFIVALKKDLQKDELRTLLFDEQKEIELYDYAFSVDVLMDAISHDYVNQEPRTFRHHEKEFVEELCNGWYDGQPEHPREFYNLKGEERQKAWDIYYMIDKATAERRVQSFLLECCGFYPDDFYVYFFSYSDGYGLGCVLEHGNTFGKVPHIRISHH